MFEIGFAIRVILLLFWSDFCVPEKTLKIQFLFSEEAITHKKKKQQINLKIKELQIEQLQQSGFIEFNKLFYFYFLHHTAVCKKSKKGNGQELMQLEPKSHSQNQSGKY